MWMDYDEQTKTYFMKSMIHLSVLFILLIGQGYELDSIYSNCGFTGEGFILLALTKNEQGKLMEYKQLMLCFRNKENKNDKD